MKDFTKSMLTTGAAIVVLAGLAVYAWQGDKRSQKDAKEKEEQKKLFAVKKESVNAIEMRVRGVETKIVRADGRWVITAPIRADGDQTAIDALVGAFDTLRAERTVEEKPADIMAYGLATPEITIRLTMADGTTAGLSVGMKNDFDNTYYLQRDGGTAVYQAQTSSRFSFDKDLFALREKKLFFAEKNEDIQKASVALDGLSYALERDADRWRLSGPADDRADDEEVAKVLNALRSLRATAVSTEQQAAGASYGLDRPAAVLSIWKGPERALQQVTIGKVQAGGKTKLYAVRAGAGTVWEIAEQILKDVDKKPFELRYKKALDFKREEVKKVILSNGGVQWTIEKGAAADEWEITAPERAKARPYKMSAVLYNLTNLKAAEFAPEGAAPREFDLDPPKRSVTLLDANGKELGRLAIGSDTAGRPAALTNIRDRVIILEKARVDEIPWALADYKDDGSTPPAKPGAPPHGAMKPGAPRPMPPPRGK